MSREKDYDGDPVSSQKSELVRSTWKHPGVEDGEGRKGNKEGRKEWRKKGREEAEINSASQCWRQLDFKGLSSSTFHGGFVKPRVQLPPPEPPFCPTGG